jgi:hypothetical protein
VITLDPALCHRQFLPAMLCESVETEAPSTWIRHDYSNVRRPIVIGTKCNVEFAKRKAVPCIDRISFVLDFACVHCLHKCTITQTHIAENCPWNTKDEQ